MSEVRKLRRMRKKQERSKVTDSDSDDLSAVYLLAAISRITDVRLRAGTHLCVPVRRQEQD